MASIDINIVIIALPAIIREIGIDSFSSFQYLLWMLFGYYVVTATLLVTFGRLSDMYGRVRLYNLGFAILYDRVPFAFPYAQHRKPGCHRANRLSGRTGHRGRFLFSNSVAILTDAFPVKERGKALGINQVAFLAGSVLGLVVGGILAVYNWRYVFLVSVPFGAFGTIWSYLKLKEVATIRKAQKLDIWGNVTFGGGLTLLLVSITYAIRTLWFLGDGMVKSSCHRWSYRFCSIAHHLSLHRDAGRGTDVRPGPVQEKDLCGRKPRCFSCIAIARRRHFSASYPSPSHLASYSWL